MRRPVPSLAAFLLLLLLTLAGPAPARAQLPTPADSAAVLLEAARSFEDQEDARVARALYRHILARFPGTPAAAVARDRLARVSSDDGGGSGAVELQVWSTLYGAWLGVAIPGAFGADDAEPYGAGLLVGAPLGFVTGRWAARSNGYTLGQARAITLGGTWGTWQGYGWREVLDLGVEEICALPESGGACYESGGDSEETFAAMVVGGLAGVAVGAALARRPVSVASAAGANYGSLWGSWFGLAGGILTDQEEDALLATTLLGGNAGLVAGALLTPRWGWSRNRWRVVSAGGLLGGLAGLGVDLLAQPDDDKVAVAIPLVGSLVGLAVGRGLSRDMDGPGEGAGEGVGALLHLGSGGAEVGLPLPHPRLRPVHGPRGTELRTQWGVTLLSARFR